VQTTQARSGSNDGTSAMDAILAESLCGFMCPGRIVLPRAAAAYDTCPFVMYRNETQSRYSASYWVEDEYRARIASFLVTMRRVRLHSLLPFTASAVLVLAALLLIFFCPLSQGPFSATHGPVTALRASRAASLILISIAFATMIVRKALAAFALFSPIPLLLCFTRQDDIAASIKLGDSLPLICELRC